MSSFIYLIVFVLTVLLPFVLLFWIYNDAESNYNAGCLWVILTLIFGWFAIIAYLIIRHAGSAGRTRVPRLGEDGFTGERTGYSAFGRGAAATQTKTLYGGSDYPDTPEFRDHRAEELLNERKYDEAETYLRDMAKIAKDEGNDKRITTYRYYYGRLKDFREKYPQEKKDDDGPAGSFKLPKR